MNEKLSNNAKDLNLELEWFARLLETRMALYFEKECSYQSIYEVSPPEFAAESSLYAGFLDHYSITFEQRVALVLTLIPHVKPQLLDLFFIRNSTYDRGFTEFGGQKGKTHSGFMPTGETLLFLLSGGDLELGLSVHSLFDRDHFFAKHNILKMDPVADGEPIMSGVLRLSEEVLDYFTSGTIRKPDLSIKFPARHITTDLEWGDLVLEQNTAHQIDEIRTWIEHGHVLINGWGLGKKIRPGYRCLFYGPPGTGKSMTACLLGKSTGKDVYRVDLSMVVSKYIGETEKNLSRVFEQAESKNWILFFDEADALFGKRTGVKDAHDRYANQEVSYLLQRIEIYDGIIILASNMKGNLDEAFTRRFESIIPFPIPKSEERRRLWEKGFSSKCVLENKINLEEISSKYELSGGSTMNVIRYSSLMALRRNSNEIKLNDLEEGIKKEFQKEGKTI
ncbi:ATP-binding protein [Reichenbachiella sp.]|uniref:ATP-binding protein n=1 Tax=Reichenbachiella sp. TaxID=2184521 RepID=UPI00329A12E1